ncbi:type VI-A CRISPR-associated RNA-guided ribonuclease Cas13a [Candidatus Tokpelaia sp.]|uniref:type VI-A CRISPR-associated RNA-guided ribonuclease Cas13a n=1 Tax=Candidatus Tokpelaia sp. TaxID=2233777 RepID=UPI002110E03A|nr:type VI-A CRISPR-associated RNA-guided ribonuclease Cas13a [Candidatus Tokpelaia sp.]
MAAFCDKKRWEKLRRSRIYDRLRVESNSAGAPWQSRLYFLLHLMPVEEAGSLRQQLKKWEIVTDKSHGEQGRGGDILTRLLAVFDLYIAMHDAQFAGAELASLELDKKTAQALFVNPGDFRQIFPEKKDGVEDEHLPIRGLREMQRFGTSLLHNFYENHKITGTSVARWQELEKIIAQEQRKLKHLHRDWVKSKNRKNDIKWGAEEETAYKSALKLVTEYRHLTAQVMLQSHVRLHRLLIKILGRLVDFAGLWERDLYFVLLARLHLKGVKTEDIAEQFKDKGAKLENGQIVVALRELKDTGLQAKVADLLNQKETKEIRNGFDHFDTLKVKYFPVNLTAEIDKARRLMAYDRKLKNAVTKSVIDLLKRETIELKWSMGADHKLEKVSFISSAKAFHLDKESGNNKIVEELCDSHFIAMAKSLFTGE